MNSKPKPRPIKRQIVLAWAVREVVAVEERRRDLGERPTLTIGSVPRAAMWKNRGTQTDVEKAEAYARSEPGKCVYVYPSTVRDPLAAAKMAVMKDIAEGKLKPQQD